MTTKTISLKEEMAKKEAAKQAAEQQAQQQAIQQAEIEAGQRFLDYQNRQAELKKQLEEAQRKKEESKKQVVTGYRDEKESLTRRQLGPVPSHQARYPDPDQVVLVRDIKVPIYATQYDESAIQQVNFVTGQIESLEKESSAYAAQNPAYSQKLTAHSTEQNIKSAQSRLESLRQSKAQMSATTPPSVPKGATAEQRMAANEALHAFEFAKSEVDSQIRQVEQYLSAGDQAKALQTTAQQYQPIRYSSERDAIGYNILTGKVELGAMGAGGAQVVSQSRAEDVMDLQRTAKEAGYTKGATIDPRIGVFKTVDSGILTPGMKAQPSKDIVRQFAGPPQPQQTRPKILTDQPDSKYANPDFVSKENQRKADQNRFADTNKFEGSIFDYGSIFSGGPPRPRELSDIEMSGMSEQQINKYNQSIITYNKWVDAETKRIRQEQIKNYQTNKTGIISFLKEAKAQGFTLLDIKTGDRKETIPIDSAFGRLITGGEAVISYQDPKLKQARIDFVETRRAQKKWLKEVEASGAGFISIKSSLGTQVVPLETAWDAIKKAPADAQISTRLPVAEKGIGPDKQTRDIMKYEQGRREISQDPLSQLTYASEKQAEKDSSPVNQFIKQLQTDALSFIGGTINTAENISVGINRGVGNIQGVNEKKLSKFPEPTQQFYMSKNWVSEFQGGLLDTKYYKEIDIGFGIKANLPTWSTVKSTVSRTGEYMRSVGPTRVISQGLFSYATLNPEAGIKAVPLRYTKAAIPVETKIMPGLTPKAPRTPTIIGAPQVPDVTPTITARAIALGYGGEKSVIIGGKYGEPGGNKPFLGRPTPSKLGIEGITPPTGKLDALELASYNKLQRKIIDDAFKYGEETGVVKPGTISLQKLEDKERKKQVKNLSNIKMEPKTPSKVEGVPLEAGEETQNVFAGAADIQKKGFVESVKGSLLTNMIAGWVKRPQGDLMDLEAAIPKRLQRQSANLQREVTQLREKAVRETDPKKREKIFSKLRAKQDELKIKQDEMLANADAAADYIIQNVKVGEGKTLVRQGFNIYITDADYTKPRFNIEIPDKKFYQSEIIAAHGTDVQGAMGIIQKGADPKMRPYGEPAFFATPSQDILKTFASQRVVLGKLAESDILLYKNIPKRDRLQILEQSRRQARTTSKPEWRTYQETLSRYAKDKGYKGVTKPYHSTNPLSDKYEIIIFEKGVFKPTEIVKPTGYEGLPGAKQKEVINIVTSKEELNDILGDISGNVGKPFGDKWPEDTFKAQVGDTGKKLELYKVPYQSVAKAKAISGIQSAASIAQDFSHPDTWKQKLIGSYRVVKSPKTHRYDKDPLDFYMLTYRNVKEQVEKGDIKGARESVQTALAMRKYYTGTDFIQGARQYKNFDTITPDKEPSPSFSQRIESASVRSPITITSPRSGKENRVENAPSPSVRISTKSSLGSSGMISPNLIMLSARSARSTSSVKSTRQSPISPKSISSAKPSPLSNKSPKSFQSPKSPSSPFSPRSPRPVSPASPKSPPSPRPTSILSPPSPKIISPPSPRISPLISPIDLKVPPPRTIRIIRPPRTRTDKQKPDKPKGREDFFGSSHAAEVLGFRKTKRGRPTDFDYGDVKTARLVEQDIKLTTKGRDRFLSSGKKNALISKSKPEMIQSEKSRQKNTFGAGKKWKKVF